jgi:rod shape-determining protein MreB
VTVPANLTSPARPAGQRRAASAPRTAPPAAVAVDLGSSTVGVWAAHRGTITGPCGDALASTSRLVRRGRVLDVEGCIALLSQLIRRYSEPVPAGAVVAACRPVLAGEQDQAVLRHVLEAVFAPTRLVFIDTVRAAAIGSGAAAGTLLIADLGAQLTEVALLNHGRVVAARRAEIGTRDLARGATVDLIAEIVARHVTDLRSATAGPDLAPAIARGMLLAGDGAAHPDLTLALSTALHLPVHRAASPRTAALNGAGLAAMSLLRHPAQS